MKTKPYVGQVLFSLNIGNAARWKPSVLTAVIVRSVGRKYFLCSPNEHPRAETKYRIADWSEETGGYSATSHLYAHAKEWEDERECSELSKVIFSAFEYGSNKHGIPLEVLRQIAALCKQ